jgi:uncharacterized protein (UPF0332 family)
MDKRIRDWEICKKEHINKVQVDKEKINSILKMSDILLKVTKQIKKDEETSSIVTGNYYEIIKELLTALLLKNGMKSDDHECKISFFKKYYQGYDYEANLIHELKNIRNRIYYDGIFVKKSYLDKNELEFNYIIELLIKLIKNENS